MRSGSFKHCSKSIALIKKASLHRKKEKEIKHKLFFFSFLRSSVKLEKSEIYKANFCHVANDNTIERLSEQQ